jgi:hypothetical protein
MNDKTTVLTGDKINGARLLVLRSALKLECKGMKASRGVNAFKMIKEEFNLKGNKEKVLEQFENYLRENRILIDEKTKEVEPTSHEFNLDGKMICFHKDNTILVEVGKGKGSYKTKYSFKAQDFAKAVMHYNGINIGNGYKKRLICNELNKPLLARQIS